MDNAKKLIPESYKVDGKEFEMTDGNEGSNDWADTGIEIGSFVTEMSRGNNQAGLKLLYFGYVVSNLHNDVDAIASIDLPIAVS